jgi:hypothetical protein
MNGSRCRALAPWDRGRWVAACCAAGAGSSRRCRKEVAGGAGRKRGGDRPGGWLGSTWGSHRGIRYGCWRLTGGWCAGRRVCRRWSRWPRWSGRRWPGRRREPRWRWCPGPTGPAWLPIAVFFARRGHAVYRVSSAKAADLRRFLRRHAKSNGIDAETLARIPLADPGGLQPLELPGAAAAALDRRVRACAWLTQPLPGTRPGSRTWCGS